MDGAGADEARAALWLLAPAGVAVVMALRAVCGLLGARERETGRCLTSEEIESLLAVIALVPEMSERLAGVERTLQGVTTALEELARAPRPRRDLPRA